MSTAGSAGSYRFHARSADGRVADVTAISPSPANVTVTVLSRDGDGSASAELLQVVSAALNDEDVRPVADRVIVQSAKIAPYVIEAVLYLYPGGGCADPHCGKTTFTQLCADHAPLRPQYPAFRHHRGADRGRC